MWAESSGEQSFLVEHDRAGCGILVADDAIETDLVRVAFVAARAGIGRDELESLRVRRECLAEETVVLESHPARRHVEHIAEQPSRRHRRAPRS